MKNFRLRPILIFTSKYLNDNALNRIGVDNTAKIMREAIFSSKGLDIPEEDGMILLNERFVTACERINRFVKSLNNETDICMFYYCGHGFAEYNKRTVHIAMTDTTTNNWDTCAYDIKNVISLIKELDIKHYIIILDCCHSGFLCDMGGDSEDKYIDIGEFDEAVGAVYVSSTQAADVCNQMCIDGKYYLPFSYFFANVLLGHVKDCATVLSVAEVFELVRRELDKLAEYNTMCRMQCKDKFANVPLFDIKKGESLDISEKFGFKSYFEITRLNVLLVKTAINYPVKQDDFGVPLGLWLLKGYLSTTGLSLNVEIYDERLELRKCGNDNEKRKEVRQNFKKIIEDYDVIGISLCSSEVPPAIEKFEVAKKQGKITFCGGIFTTSNEEFLVNTGVIDYVIPGVGTVPLSNLLARLIQEKKKGVLGRNRLNVDGVVSKEYLYLFDRAWIPAQLPSMRKSVWLEILNRYGEFLKNRMDIYTARGCDRNCSFCSVQMESCQVVYRKEIQSVINEIQYLKTRGITYFSFKDENFISVPDRMKRILSEVKGEGIKFKIRARYDEMVDSGISLQELQELGVDEVQYGIESPNIYIRRNVKKGFSSSLNQKLVEFIKEHEKHGITANCSFILGISGEDNTYYDELEAFIKAIYSEKSNPKIYINFLTPHPYNSQFPSGEYCLVTKDLNYFTHKFPVCFPQNSTYGIRRKMLQTYEKIVTYTKSELYNPLEFNKHPSLMKDFLYGNTQDKRSKLIQGER